MSFLTTVVADAKKGFAWFASPKGQAIVGLAETSVEIAFPPTTAAFALFNTWAAEVVKIEAIATATGAQSGTGVQKAAVVISNMTPQVLAWAAANGYSVPDAAQIAAINTGVVNVLNLLGATSTPATPTTATPVVSASAIVDGGKAL